MKGNVALVIGIVGVSALAIYFLGRRGKQLLASDVKPFAPFARLPESSAKTVVPARATTAPGFLPSSLSVGGVTGSGLGQQGIAAGLMLIQSQLSNIAKGAA